MVNYGLVGKTLGHSFSGSYFEQKFRELGLPDHRYLLFELNTIDELRERVLSTPELRGFNVTIPFKEKIIGYLDHTDALAMEVGAVNCVKLSGGRTHGYNTDVYGFSQSIKPFLDTNHGRALILGTGGASRAVAHALKKIGVEIFFATTSAKKGHNYFHYGEINDRVMNACKLIVNTTPLGMFPDSHEFPDLPYHLFTPEHLAYDLIYNPGQTPFLKKAAGRGAVTVNGLSMLQLQAEKSWEIWNGAGG